MRRVKQFVADPMAPEVNAQNLTEKCIPIKSWRGELRTFLWNNRKILKIGTFINPFGPVLDRLGNAVINEVWFSNPDLIHTLESLFYGDGPLEDLSPDFRIVVQAARDRVAADKEIRLAAVQQQDTLRHQRRKERIRFYEELEFKMNKGC